MYATVSPLRASYHIKIRESFSDVPPLSFKCGVGGPRWYRRHVNGDISGDRCHPLYPLQDTECEQSAADTEHLV